MILKKIAYEITNIFSLKEHESLTKEQKQEMVEKIVKDVYDKGKCFGHNNAVNICIDVLKEAKLK